MLQLRCVFFFFHMPMGLHTTPGKINVLLSDSLTEAITSGCRDEWEHGWGGGGLESDFTRKYRTLKLNETFESILFYPCGKLGR